MSESSAPLPPAPAAPAYRDPFPWERAAVSLALLAAVGASIGLLVGGLALPGFSLFVTKNTITLPERQRLLINVLGGAAGPVALALVALAYGGRLWLGAIERTARLLSPLMLVGLTPALFAYSIWHKEPTTYLFLLALTVLLAEPLLAMSLDALPGWVLGPVADRWQATSSQVRRWVPLGAVLAGCLGYTLFAGYYSIVFHQKLQTSGFDLGIYDNLMFNALRGDFFRSPVLFGPKGGNYLAGHAEFVLVLFTPLYALWPRADMLLWLQAALLGFAALPLYLFARTLVPRATAALVALAYLLYAPLHGPNFYDFHWLPCAIFFHFWLYYALAAERYKLAWAMVVVLFLTREDIAVGLAVLGIVLMLTRWRVLFGMALSLLSVTWFILDKFVIMKWAGTWWFANIYKDLMAPGESSYASIVKTILINPVFFVSTLLKQDKLEYSLHLMAPLAFLPIRRPMLLLLAVPGFFFTLMTTGYGPTLSIAFQYTTHWIPYLFAATVVALHLLSRGEGGVTRRRAALGALLLGVLSHSYIYGFILQQKVFVGGFQRMEFTYPEADRLRYLSLRQLIAMIPRNASVAATENEVPHISNRRTAFTLRDHHGDAEYLLIGKNKLGFGNTKPTIKDAFARNTYGLLAQDTNFYLFKLNHQSPETEAAINALGVAPTKTP